MSLLVPKQTLAKQYIQANTDYYMARGHETAKADYVYGSHHRATFWFMNVAPQWQTFNGGNWNTLEDNVRTYSEGRTANLNIYTGISGKIPDDSGRQHVRSTRGYINENYHPTLPPGILRQISFSLDVILFQIKI